MTTTGHKDPAGIYWPLARQRLKDFEERTMKHWAIAAEKEERKKKKGKGPCSTQ